MKKREMKKVIFENISFSESTKDCVAKMSNPQNVEEYIAYHIYIPTPEYQLKKGESYCTDSISRNFSISCSEKQKAEALLAEHTKDEANMTTAQISLAKALKVWYS